jgi:hypothetical protein
VVVFFTFQQLLLYSNTHNIPSVHHTERRKKVLEAEGDKRQAELQSEGEKIRMKNESEGTLIKVTNEAEARKIQLILEVLHSLSRVALPPHNFQAIPFPSFEWKEMTFSS